MANITHDFKVYDKQGFIKTLAKIVKRYKVETNVVWGDTYTEKIFVGGADLTTFGSDGSMKITIHPVSVDFDFDEFKIEGYQYLGCIKDELMMGLITIHGNDLLEGKEVSDFVKTFDEIPCHNCNRRHKRKVGHLFLHEDTKEVLVFGSSCAKNFFGINFDRLLNFFERINVDFSEGWDEDYVRGYRSKLINWKSAARLAYYEISKNGYMSVTKSKEFDKFPTSEAVQQMYNGNEDFLTKEVKDGINEMIEKNLFPEMDVLYTTEYVTKIEGLNDFEHNLLVLQESMKHDCVTYKSYGFISYMVWNEFFKAIEQPKSEKVEYVIPEWAEKGKRIKKNSMKVEVEVTAIKIGEGSYGNWYLYTMVADDVQYKWFSSNELDVEVGDTITLNGFSIKSIEKDPKYGNSVMISRVIVEK